MKAKKLISFALCLCMIMSSICAVSFTVSAEDNNVVNLFSYSDPTTIANDWDTDKTVTNDLILGNFTENLDTPSYSLIAESKSVGGKAKDDIYAKYNHGTNSNIEPTIYFKNGVSSSQLDKKYFVISFNLLGNSFNGDINSFVRISGSSKPKYAVIPTSKLIKNKWNNVVIAFDNTTKTGIYYLNGTKYDGDSISESLETAKNLDIRITVGKGNDFYLDDINVYKTDMEPNVAYNATLSGGITRNDNLYIYGDHATITVNNGAARAFDNTLTNEESLGNVSNGNVIVCESVNDFGTMYKYFNVISLSKTLDGEDIAKIEIGSKTYDNTLVGINEPVLTTVSGKLGKNSSDISANVDRGGTKSGYLLYQFPFATPEDAYSVVEFNAQNTDGELQLKTNSDKIVYKTSNYNKEQWNKFIFVYNGTTKKANLYVNGILVENSNNVENELSTQMRIVFTSSFSIDDFKAYMTQTAPIVTTPAAPNTTLDGANALYAPGAKVSAVTADNAAVRVYDSTLTTQKESYNYLNEGDIIVTENTAKDYGYYTVKYSKNGVLYAQGDSKVIYSYTKGNGEDVKVDENAVFNNKPMTKITSGTSYNATGVYQTQSYYQANWSKAGATSKPKYLVLESDFAFDNENPCKNFFISTKGGKALGVAVNFDAKYKDRINHITWIYDTANGTYSEYVNDNIIAENAQLTGDAANFITGADGYTPIRFGIGSEEAKAQVGYIANLVIYETDTPVMNVKKSLDDKKATVEIKNEITAERTITIVLAQYDDDGNIAAVDYKSATVEADGTISAELTLANDKPVSCFVVDTLGNLKPYCAPITIK